MPGFSPRCWNQLPKRTGKGAPVAAIAVPLPLRKQSSSGSPTTMEAAPTVPRRAVLRLNVVFIGLASRLVLAVGVRTRHPIELGAGHDAPHEFGHVIAGLRERRLHRLDPGLVGLLGRAADCIGAHA